MEPEPELHCK